MRLPSSQFQEECFEHAMMAAKMENLRDSLVYKPRLIDTTHVALPRTLLELTEHLAENVHSVWARRRMAEGWVWGPTHNEMTRQHPRLVPYPELPESEKQYDRETALETLKAILALGYRIERDS